MKQSLQIVSLFSLFTFSTQAQVQNPLVIEVEASGVIEFIPDSFWVSIRSSVYGGYDEELEAVEAEAAPEAEVLSDVKVEPPVDQSSYSVEQKILMQRIDSLRIAKELQAQEIERGFKKLKIGPEYAYKMQNETQEEMMNRYRINGSWVQKLSTRQFRYIDSLINLDVRGLDLDLITIVVNSDNALKAKAYKKAMEEGKKEAEILAGTMDKKLGKLVQVSTESMGVEDFVPILMGRELRREFRKKDRLGPSLYQLSREFGLSDEQPNDQKQVWTWTEKVTVRYQVQ